VDIYRSPNIGIFLKTNDKLLLAPRGLAPSKGEKLKEALGVSVCYTSIAGSRLLGPLAAMNNNGILVSRLTEDVEMREIAAATASGQGRPRNRRRKNDHSRLLPGGGPGRRHEQWSRHIPQTGRGRGLPHRQPPRRRGLSHFGERRCAVRILRSCSELEERNSRQSDDGTRTRLYNAGAEGLKERRPSRRAVVGVGRSVKRNSSIL